MSLKVNRLYCNETLTWQSFTSSHWFWKYGLCSSKMGWTNAQNPRNWCQSDPDSGSVSSICPFGCGSNLQPDFAPTRIPSQTHQKRLRSRSRPWTEMLKSIVRYSHSLIKWVRLKEKHIPFLWTWQCHNPIRRSFSHSRNLCNQHPPSKQRQHFQRKGRNFPLKNEKNTATVKDKN